MRNQLVACIFASDLQKWQRKQSPDSMREYPKAIKSTILSGSSFIR